ncbi:MAG: outer membrane protein assembly factor BamD [Pirellulaceae bacterium]
MPPTAHRILQPQPAALCALTLAALLLCTAAGCSMFGNRDDDLTDYDTIRRQVEGNPYRNDIAAVDYQEEETEQVVEEEEAPGLLGGLAPSQVAKSFKRLIGKEPDRKEARRLYALAEAKYREALAAQQEQQRKALFNEAGGLFSQAAGWWPESTLEQDALFLAGESYFFGDRFPTANEQYELLLKKYPNARQLDKVEARRFSIAQFWLQLEQARPQSFFALNITDEKRPWRDAGGNAVRVFDKIRIDDPTGRLADDATLAAANAHFLKGDFARADDFYTDLRKTFPSSEHQFKAHFLGLQCKLKTYQGPAYDGTALDEADRLLQVIRKQFPEEADKEREYLARAWAEVRYKLAQREWALAQYYDFRREFGGARYHYGKILEEYDDTPYGERTRKRLEQIDGLPDVPPQRLSWLINLFPSSKQGRVRPLIPSDVPLGN